MGANSCPESKTGVPIAPGFLVQLVDYGNEGTSVNCFFLSAMDILEKRDALMLFTSGNQRYLSVSITCKSIHIAQRDELEFSVQWTNYFNDGEFKDNRYTEEARAVETAFALNEGGRGGVRFGTCP